MKHTTIRVKANKSKRTFTIRKYHITNKAYVKFRTYKMSKLDFEDSEMNSESDWYHFLKNENYYKVK